MGHTQCKVSVMLNYMWINTSSSLSHELCIRRLEMNEDNSAHKFEDETVMGIPGG